MANNYYDYNIDYKNWEESEFFYMDLLNLIFSKEIQRKNLKSGDLVLESSLLWRYWDLLLEMNPENAEQFKLFEDEFGKQEQEFNIRKKEEKSSDIIRIEIDINDHDLIKEIAYQRILKHLSKSRYNTFELFKSAHIATAKKHLAAFSNFYSFPANKRYHTLTTIWLKIIESLTLQDLETYGSKSSKKQPTLKIIQHTVNDPADRWFNLTELVEYLPGNPAKSTIYAKVSARKIPHYKEGKQLSFLKSEIDAWLKDGRVKTREELQDIADENLLRSTKRKK